MEVRSFQVGCCTVTLLHGLLSTISSVYPAIFSCIYPKKLRALYFVLHTFATTYIMYCSFAWISVICFNDSWLLCKFSVLTTILYYSHWILLYPSSSLKHDLAQRECMTTMFDWSLTESFCVRNSCHAIESVSSQLTHRGRTVLNLTARCLSARSLCAYCQSEQWDICIPN